MTTDHWFDRLNKTLMGNASRRNVLRSAILLAGGWFLAPRPSEAGAATGKRCARQLCAQNFASRKQRRACQEKCGRCRVRGKFCIAGPDLAHPDADRHATCCKNGQKCCQDGFLCCPETATCCPASHVAAGKAGCCGSGVCCLESETGCCLSGQECCPGVGCVPQGECQCANSSDVCCNISCGPDRECCPDATSSTGIKCPHLLSDRDHCGSCGNACGPYPMACCFGECRDTSSDVRSCKTCSFSCQPGQLCVDGSCRWPE